MTGGLAPAVGLVGVAVVLATVLGAVDRSERFVFVAGVVVLGLGPILVASGSISAPLGGAVALVGFLAIVASTVPLLRQSPTLA